MKSIMRLILIMFLLIPLPSCFSNEASDKKLFDDITKEINEKSFTSQNEEEYTKLLRSKYLKMSVNEIDNIVAGDIPLVVQAFSKIKEHIRKELNIDINEYKEGENSCGVVLFKRKEKNKDKTIDTLLREARCMSMAAIDLLTIIYQHNVQGYEDYRSKIFDFFKVMAEEDVPRSQLMYGQILLHGWNGKKDVNTGLKFLKLASNNLGEAAFELGLYFYSQNNATKSQEYFKQAAELGSSDAMYELAIFALEKQNYKEAAALLSDVLSQDPNNDAAKIELARLYGEGLGVKKDCRKGFSLMKEVSEKTNDEKAKAISNMNLGIFYMNGVGIERSLNKAKECFSTALTCGYEDASKYIEKLDKLTK